MSVSSSGVIQHRGDGIQTNGREDHRPQRPVIITKPVNVPSSVEASRLFTTQPTAGSHSISAIPHRRPSDQHMIPQSAVSHRDPHSAVSAHPAHRSRPSFSLQHPSHSHLSPATATPDQPSPRHSHALQPIKSLIEALWSQTSAIVDHETEKLVSLSAKHDDVARSRDMYLSLCEELRMENSLLKRELKDYSDLLRRKDDEINWLRGELAAAGAHVRATAPNAIPPSAHGHLQRLPPSPTPSLNRRSLGSLSNDYPSSRSGSKRPREDSTGVEDSHRPHKHLRESPPPALPPPVFDNDSGEDVVMIKPEPQDILPSGPMDVDQSHQRLPPLKLAVADLLPVKEELQEPHYASTPRSWRSSPGPTVPAAFLRGPSTLLGSAPSSSRPATRPPSREVPPFATTAPSFRPAALRSPSQDSRPSPPELRNSWPLPPLQGPPPALPLHPRHSKEPDTAHVSEPQEVMQSVHTGQMALPSSRERLLAMPGIPFEPKPLMPTPPFSQEPPSRSLTPPPVPTISKSLPTPDPLPFIKPAAPAKPISAPSSRPAREKFGFHNIHILALSQGDQLTCRMCMSDSSRDGPAFRCGNAAVKDILGHCREAHAVAFRELETKSHSELIEFQQRMGKSR